MRRTLLVLEGPRDGTFRSATNAARPSAWAPYLRALERAEDLVAASPRDGDPLALLWAAPTMAARQSARMGCTKNQATLTPASSCAGAGTNSASPIRSRSIPSPAPAFIPITERFAASLAESSGRPALYTAGYGNEPSVQRIHAGNGEHIDLDEVCLHPFERALADCNTPQQPPPAWAQTSARQQRPCERTALPRRERTAPPQRSSLLSCRRDVSTE